MSLVRMSSKLNKHYCKILLFLSLSYTIAAVASEVEMISSTRLLTAELKAAVAEQVVVGEPVQVTSLGTKEKFTWGIDVFWNPIEAADRIALYCYKSAAVSNSKDQWKDVVSRAENLEKLSFVLVGQNESAKPSNSDTMSAVPLSFSRAALENLKNSNIKSASDSREEYKQIIADFAERIGQSKLGKSASEDLCVATTERVQGLGKPKIIVASRNALAESLAGKASTEASERDIMQESKPPR